MRNFLIAAAAATALSASNASAADIAAKPYVKVPPVPVYNWTGFYIGGNVGGQWLDSGYDASYPPLALVGSRGLRHTSVIGGGQIGYNWQFSPNWLLGIEGDISYADHDTGALIIQTATPTDHIDGGARLRTQGAIRGRLGWTSNAWLLYAVGGIAFGQTDTALSIVRNGVGADTRTSSDTRVGWTVGAGVEYMMTPNWILGVEYRYTDLGRADVIVPAGAFPAGHGIAFGSADYRTNDVRARISYKFGAPVVAKN